MARGPQPLGPFLLCTKLPFQPTAQSNYRKIGMSRKSKALPGAFQHDGTATINQAYSELSRSAFAVWIRLMAEPPDVLKLGKAHLAGLLGYGLRRTDEVLTELRRKGYIGVIRPEGVAAPLTIVIRRRALINARVGSFQRLSSILCDDHFHTSRLSEKSIQKPHSGYMSPIKLWFEPIKLWTSAGVNFEPRNPNGRCLLTISHVRKHNATEMGFGLSSVLHDKTLPPPPIFRGQKCRIPDLQPATLQKKSPIDLDLLRSSFSKDRSLRKNASRREAVKRAKRKGKPVDWTVVDKHGDPAISFEPGHPDRRALLEVLSRNTKDGERKHLIEKLTTEFCRIYTRYRRQAERALSGFSVYEVMDGERKHAANAAIGCVQKGVTPSHLIQYWDANVGNFTNMRIPTITFLASANIIDQAACSALPSKAKKGEKPKAGNSFSEVTGLDVRLRAALEREGFDTRAFNDRYLIGIQHNAMALAQGKRIFMGKTKAADMAKWAAANLYAEEE